MTTVVEHEPHTPPAPSPTGWRRALTPDWLHVPWMTTLFFGIGILLVVYGDFALGWPAWVPWRGPLVHVAAACLLLGGAGLLFARTAPIAARLLLPCLLLWTALRIPTLLKAPLVEVNWFAVGEIVVLAAGAWALFAQFSTARGGPLVRFADSSTSSTAIPARAAGEPS